MQIIIVVATDPDGAIAYNNQIPWEIPMDMMFFKKAISIAPKGLPNVIMIGRKTFDCMGGKPIPGKINVVISRNKELIEANNKKGLSNLKFVSSIEEGMEYIRTCRFNNIYVCGGKTIYEHFLHQDNVTLYLTRIAQKVTADVYINIPFEKYEYVEMSRTYEQNGFTFDFTKLVPKTQFITEENDQENVKAVENMKSILNVPVEFMQEKIPFIRTRLETRHHPEFQYLDLLTDALENGVRVKTRTGTDALAIVGRIMRFDLTHGFPLLTTKKVNFDTVIKELLWFIKGDTNGQNLLDQDVKIWYANGTREYLDSRGHQHRREHDLGPIYGFQWRHWGAKYDTCDSDYTGQGIDQLQKAIDLIRTEPHSRRIIISGWNVADLDDMALPPCHCFFHFHPVGDKLNLFLYQRSCDIGLGVPFNISSYAAMLLMVCKITGFLPGEFVHCLGNAHIYVDHIEPLKTQINRMPKPFPHVTINGDQKEIDDFKLEDFVCEGYYPHPFIKMNMAV